MASQAIKSVPSTRFRAFTANQHQVAAGLCRRLSSAVLTGAVPSATAPATARHASGMENESKNHSAPPPAVGLIIARNLVKHSKSSPVHSEKLGGSPSQHQPEFSGDGSPSPACCRRENPNPRSHRHTLSGASAVRASSESRGIHAQPGCHGTARPVANRRGACCDAPAFPKPRADTYPLALKLSS